MRGTLSILFFAIFIPAIQTFQVSWLTAPNEIEQEFASVPRYRPERLPPWPYSYRHSYSSSIMVDEDNQVCARFHCSLKPCCAGECVHVFGKRFCILLPSYPVAYGRR